MWHGTRENRQYSQRHEILKQINDIGDLLTENEDNVYEFRPSVYQKYNAFFIKYFEERKDDDLSVVGFKPEEKITKETS